MRSFSGQGLFLSGGFRKTGGRESSTVARGKGGSLDEAGGVNGYNDRQACCFLNTVKKENKCSRWLFYVDKEGSGQPWV